MIVNIWIVGLILFAMYMIDIIFQFTMNELEKGSLGIKINIILYSLIVIFYIIIANPIVFNSIFAYLKLDIILNWRDALPLSLCVSIMTSNTLTDFKVNKLWGDRRK